jgi:hypothetical protein
VVGAVWALAGLAIAGGLMAGAFALAGEDISQPATTVIVPTTRPQVDTDDTTRSPEPHHSPSASPTQTHDAGDHHGGPPATDDHGGSSSGSDGSGSNVSGSGPGSEDGASDGSSGGSEDGSSGSGGSSEDHSGSGDD